MNYLITGGTGHLGARVTHDLVNDGHQVIIYDMFPDNTRLEMMLDENKRDMVKIVQGDILDFDFLMQTTNENSVDIIIHLAVVLLDERYMADPRRGTMVNSVGTLNVFEVARLLGLKKVAWASSNTVFSDGPPSEVPIANNAPHYPWGPYAAAKSFGERLSDFYFQNFGVDITAMRYGGFIYGALQERGSSGAIVRELMLNPAVGKAGKVPWGDDTVGWLYVDDAARAAILACRHRREKTAAFNIPGHVLPVKKVAELVKEIIPDAALEIIPGCMAFSTGWKLDTTETEKELGYRPLWTIQQGIRETINMERKYHGLPPV